MAPVAPSVPAKGRASADSRGRIQSSGSSPDAAPRKTMYRPAGEGTGILPKPPAAISCSNDTTNSEGLRRPVVGAVSLPTHRANVIKAKTVSATVKATHVWRLRWEP